MLEVVLASVLLAVVLSCLPVCAYLWVLTVAAPFGLRRQPRQESPSLHFAILVPAHNEARVIGRLLTSLAELDYPSRLVTTVVVADNCSDSTAAIAADSGALVFEREDRERLGKGWALAWLLDRLKSREIQCDAYVILDADCSVSPNFLQAMNNRMLAGSDIIQAYYATLPLRGTWVESLREASLALVHLLRPAGKMTFGLSCGLKGTGMTFRRSVLERCGWPATGLAEDVEFHLALVAMGYRVWFAPEAVVRAEMPASLGAAQTQNRRWEAGRLQALAGRAVPLFREGLRRRSLVQVDAAVEQLVPPLSVPVLLLCFCFSAGLAAHLTLVWASSAVMLALLALHLLAGLALARVPASVYLSLVCAPVYVCWKAGLYAWILLRGHERTWIRTARDAVE